MGRTAVIMNEFGEIGLDHDLIETSDESFVQLSNGCLCCNVRSDLVLTLCDLAARRQAGPCRHSSASSWRPRGSPTRRLSCTH
jgi:G3E family GTPase